MARLIGRVIPMVPSGPWAAMAAGDADKYGFRRMGCQDGPKEVQCNTKSGVLVYDAMMNGEAMVDVAQSQVQSADACIGLNGRCQ